MKADNTLKKITVTGKKIILIALTAFLMANSTLLGGCDSEDDSSYDLTVGWTINGFKVCSSPLPADQFVQDNIEFTTVQINIYEDETKTQSVQAPISVPCNQYEAQITRLPRDTYYITVDAYGDYDGELIPFFQSEREVSVPKVGDEIVMPLAVGLGEIQVYWQFSGGKTCGVSMAGEVANIVVLVNGEQTKTTCGAGQVLISDIVPGTQYTISAQALDANGNILYTAQYLPSVSTTTFSVLPGETYQVPLVFQ